MTETPSLSRSGLSVASLEIGRVLADRDGVAFRSDGTCMYPTIRPGDVLCIRSCAAADVAVGDIAVCRTPEHLFSHRVVGTGERDGCAYIVTRPDRSSGGRDAPTFDEDLLGVVVSIKRKGVTVPLDSTAHPRASQLYHRVRRTVLEAQPRARLSASALVAQVQQRALYRWAARRWYARRRPCLRLAVRVPVNTTLGDAVSRELEPAALDLEETWRGRRVERWTLIAKVDEGREPGAWMTFARGLDDASWRAQESHVRVRYRGSGLEQALLRQAEAIVARHGAQLEETS